MLKGKWRACWSWEREGDGEAAEIDLMKGIPVVYWGLSLLLCHLFSFFISHVRLRIAEFIY